jgi:hypothetical protein
VAARVEAWKGMNPDRIWALLSNPKLEGRLLRFLELSGVGRFIDGGIGKYEAHAAKIDG